MYGQWFSDLDKMVMLVMSVSSVVFVIVSLPTQKLGSWRLKKQKLLGEFLRKSASGHECQANVQAFILSAI